MDAINQMSETDEKSAVAEQVHSSVGSAIQLLLTAALSLPGLASIEASAENAPEQGVISARYLYYRDSQPGLNRIKASSPSIGLMMPVAEKWSIQSSMVYDNVSGASPMYHSDTSGASRMDDERYAADFSVTRYLPRGSVSLGASYSDEHDYTSRALSLQHKWSSEDNNTTYFVGAGLSHDAINDSNGKVQGMRKNTSDYLLGISRNITPQDIAQVNLTYVHGRGYFSDPYKFLDSRPSRRYETALQLRWNHYHPDRYATSRVSYRYYKNSWGIRSHTLNYEYAQQLQNDWTVTPIIRIYSQSAADFYYPTFTAGIPELSSFDQRLSSFGGRSIGVKVEKKINKDWIVDIRYDNYEQRTSWSVFNKPKDGLDKFQAKMAQIGISRYFK